MGDTASIAAPKVPAKGKMFNIIRRYLKKDRTPDWKREIQIFHKLWKQYPSFSFWTKHTLSFELNTLRWFETIQGKAQLASDWAVFHYVPELEMTTSDPLDIFPLPTEENPTVESSRVVVPLVRRPKSIADLLANHSPKSS